MYSIPRIEVSGDCAVPAHWPGLWR
jgi:hypothetical protein